MTIQPYRHPIRLAGLLLALTAACAPVQAAARGPAVGLQVGVLVPDFTSIRLLGQPNTLQVTAADVARGYVDPPEAVALMVHSNRLAGGQLLMVPMQEPVTEVQVFGLGAPVTLGRWGGVVQLPPLVVGRQDTEFRLRFRFRLAAGQPAATYPWPVTIWAWNP